MDKRFEPGLYEEKIYQLWEKAGYFTPEIDEKKEPFSIILPLPNANDSMHIGHAMFTVQDLMCRYQRMLGKIVLWLPGSDHAGIETQYVFEKHLAKEGKSRFDYDRETLFKKIWDFVEKNRKLNIQQMKKLGFCLDWTRYHYSLEPEIIEQVLATFYKLHQDDLLYRAERIVNYCPHCGTGFSDLEVNHVEKDEALYFLDYGSIQIATTRPETIFADVAIAVNPKDRRYKKLVGKTAVIPLIKKEIPIIADDLVETDFGTGALKITPAHDATDFEIGQKHNLPMLVCIDLSGKMINVPRELEGLYSDKAREKTIELLQKEKKLIKTIPLHHAVGVCYRCKATIEPLPVPQWYIKIKSLAKPATEAVEKGKTKIFPLRFKKTYLDWMNNIRDWNISRQIVWGPRIPVWYCLDCDPEIKLNFIDKNNQVVSGDYQALKDKYSFEEISQGLQSLMAPLKATPYFEAKKECPQCKKTHLLQETDTLDTWFLSGQWPLTTLGFNVKNPQKSKEDFSYFYPTSVMDTMWDILFFWVARMMMFGLYLVKEVPFKLVHLHARVVDPEGKKMSKSKGNVVEPLEIVDQYGADALRMALIYGVAPASDIALSDKKIEAMRNFCNKIWNASRFIMMQLENSNFKIGKLEGKNNDKILEKLGETIKLVTQRFNTHYYGQALELIYQFFWHDFCDQYLESIKDRREEALPVLIQVLVNSLKMLHPFAPFVTEAIYQEFRKAMPNNFLFKDEALMVSDWPTELEL